MPLEPARLRVAAQLVLASTSRDDQRDLAHVVPRHTGRGVEVDAQLVGVVDVLPPRRPWVEVDDAEVVGPHEVGGVHRAQLLGCAPGRERHRRGLQPVGDLLRHALLPDRLLLDPVDEALHHRGPVAQVHEGGIGRGKVVVHEVVLREPGLREVDLLRIGEADLMPGHLDRHMLGARHLGAHCDGPRRSGLVQGHVPLARGGGGDRPRARARRLPRRPGARRRRRRGHPRRAAARARR